MSLSRLKIEARIQALKCQIDRIKIVTVCPTIVSQNSYIKFILEHRALDKHREVELKVKPRRLILSA